MVLTVLVSCSIAAALTAIFAFRFRTWKVPRRVAIYFAGFFVIELCAERLLLPPGTLGPEVAAVCLGIALLFVVAIHATRHLEADDDEEF